MSDIQFETDRDSFSANRGANINNQSNMINFLIKKGFVKSHSQALKVLLVLAIVLIAAASYMFWNIYRQTVISADDPRGKYTEEQIQHFSPEVQIELRNNGKVL